MTNKYSKERIEKIIKEIDRYIDTTNIQEGEEPDLTDLCFYLTGLAENHQNNISENLYISVCDELECALKKLSDKYTVVEKENTINAKVLYGSKIIEQQIKCQANYLAKKEGLEELKVEKSDG